MRLWIYALALAVTSCFHPAPSFANGGKRILMVVSSHGVDDGKVRPGFEMDELAQAYLIFKANGLAIDIASPNGGPAVADEYNVKKSYNASFLADPDAKTKLANGLPLSAVRPQNYAAVFVVGGKGPMFDFPDNLQLQSLIAAIYQQGGVVAAVCHGPAALVNVRQFDGKLLAAGRRLTGFTDEEEVAFGEKWVKQFPFQVETKLREQGAVFGEAEMMLPHVEVDGRLITGQNPYSVGQAADAVVSALGKTPAARDLWTDERSMVLVAQALTGDMSLFEAELRDYPARYDIPLIAIWGYYRSQAAGDDKAGLEKGLAIMKLAAPHYREPQLQKAIEVVKAKLAAPRK